MIHIASFSRGKDSTAMVHKMLEANIPISYLMYFETGWDFLEMEEHIKKVEKNTGIKLIRVRYYRHFEELLSCYGWPGFNGGWCVACKIKTCKKFIHAFNAPKIQYMGFSADEVKRAKKKTMYETKWKTSYPLIEAKMTAADALSYCRSLGYDWSGLYDIFSRVSCFCCPNGGKTQRRKIQENFPKLEKEWQRLDVIAANRRPLLSVQE